MPLPSSSPLADEELREIVPARAALTELARGFLLVRESDRERAVRFAVTFLRERAEPSLSAPPVPYPAVPQAQRSLGRAPLGAVERLSPRGRR